MIQLSKVSLDAKLILVGVGVTGMISLATGSSLLRVVVGLTIYVAIIGLVSFLVARLVRGKLLAIAFSVVIIELLLVLSVIWPIANSPSADKYAVEAWPLIVMLGIFYTAPLVVLASIGFVGLAGTFYQRKTDSNK